MRIIRAVTDRRQIISFPLFVCKDTLEDKSYLVYFVDVSSAGSRGGARGGATPSPYFQSKLRPEGPKRFFLETAPLLYLMVRMTAPPPPLSLRSGSCTGIQVSGFA